MQSLTVLVPGYNEEKSLLKSLNSILTAGKLWPGDFKVIFSDNHSTDSSLNIARELQKNEPCLEILTSQENFGSRHNWGKLLLHVDSDLFCFIDAHDYISTNYFQQIANFLENSESPLTVFGKEIMVIQKDFGYDEYPYPHKYFFNANSKIRFWQLVFYFYHNTECHSIFMTSSFKKDFITETRGLYFDHLLLFIALQKSNLKYVESSYYYRIYREVLGPEFSHKNDAGTTEDRWQRVKGKSTEILSFQNVSREIFNASKPLLSFWEKPIALLLLKLKYSQSRSQFLLFRAVRYLFGKLTPWKT